MTTCLVGFISLLGSLSCSGPDPIGPRQDTLRPAPMLAVGSAGPCARVHVQIIGGTTAQASFAADSGCATGLALVGAGAVGYVKNQRKVSIPVRVVNRGPGGRDAPILVVLPMDSGVVTAPSNITARVVESNADSVGGAGGVDAGVAFWTLLENGGTITGDSTPVRNLQLVVPNKTAAARLAFEIRAELPDSALPIIVDRLGFPEDSSIVLSDSLLPEWRYYRRVLGVFLAPGADGIEFSALLTKFQGTVVGGSRMGRMYAVRFPDHGPSWTSMKAFLDSLHAEPIVSAAGPLLAQGPKGQIDGERLPREGGGLNRQSWLSRDERLWGMWATSAPMAWSCENGKYGSAAPLIALVEAAAPPSHVDLVPFTTVGASYFGPPSGWQAEQDTSIDRARYEAHASRVASLVGAIGDNGVGITGMVWGAPLRFYALGARNFLDARSSIEAFTRGLLPLLESDGPAIVIGTVGIGVSNDTVGARMMRNALRELLDTRPGLIWIQATGNRAFQAITPGALRSSPQEFSLIHRVLVDLREESSTYRDQIYLVGGTQVGNTRAIFPSGTEAVEIIGHTEIAAPARSVLGSRADGLPEMGDGTSFAAPLVAGTIALLRAADPALTPAKLRELILDGARVPSRDSMTGLLVAAAPVAGFQGQVYELDAYGSLKLLSQDQDDSPLCGQQVLANPPVSFSVLRDFEIVRTTPIAHAKWYPARISVAPGGRQVSAFLLEDSLNAWCGNCTGQSVATFDLMGRRIRTWKDLDARLDGEDVFAIQRPGQAAYFIDRYSQASGGLLSSTLLIDSTGGPAYVWPDHVHLHPQGRFLFYRGLVFDLTTGASTRFTPISTPTWDLSPDGSKLVALERTGPPGGPWNSRLIEFRVGVNADSTLVITGPHQDAFLAGVGLSGAYFGEEGRVVATPMLSETSGQCTVQLRPAAAFGTVAETKYWPATSCPDPNGLWQASEVRDIAARSP